MLSIVMVVSYCAMPSPGKQVTTCWCGDFNPHFLFYCCELDHFSVNVGIF